MIALNGVSKYFHVRSGFLSRQRLTVKALQQVTLEIREKEILGLVGESGSGKSTLARVIMGLYRPDEGYFTFEGFDSRSMKRDDWQNLRRDIGIVFQDPASSMNPWMSVEQIVAEPMVIRKKALRLTRAARRDRVAEILAATGMNTDSMARKIHEFSGGQRQRIAIARALVLKPRYLILDEPISALDVSIQAQILNLLKDLHAQYGFAALFITHDLSKVRWFSDRVAVMYLGRVVETAPAGTIFDRSRHPYTRALALSRLDTDFTKRDFYTLPGEIPSPVKAPPGCPFAPRCERAVAPCTAAFPPRSADTHNEGEFYCYNPVTL
ncbi:MAG: dipeptide ABC transporter ATP-binding protein [Turneriella sp.]